MKEQEERLEDLVKPAYRPRVKAVRLPWLSPFAKRCDDDWLVEFDDSDIYSPDIAARRVAKHAFATLRKAIKAYRHSPAYEHIYRHSYDYTHRVTGNIWTLRKELLIAFADWMEFSVPLDMLMVRAVLEDEKRREEEARQQRWGREQYYSQYRLLMGIPSTQMNEARQVLNLTAAATKDDIKRRYRTLAKQYHPDAGGNAEQFKRIHSAYQTLIAG